MKELLAHTCVAAIAKATQGTKFEHHLYLVGGSVRDALLGRSLKNDFDLVTDLDSAEVAMHLWESGISATFPAVYPRFGTAMVHIGNAQVELVTARKESYHQGSRKPDVQPATLEEDARRRDFTCNALMLEIHSGELLDLVETGKTDLEAGVLQTPQDPVETFRDDPLRMLRAVRFKHALGFQFAPGLGQAIKDVSDQLKNISMERIRDEFSKMLLGSDPAGALADLMELGLLVGWAPELEAMVGVTQGSYHHADVWDHTRHVVANAHPDSIELALAALLHDVGKPVTRSIDEKGNVRFFNHEVVGADLARVCCLRWRYSVQTAETVSSLVRHHMRMTSMESVSASAARRIVRDLGPNLENWMRLIEADASALKKGVRTLDLTELRARLAEVTQSNPTRRWDSPLSGAEIMEVAGLEPGPIVGQIKSYLAERIIEGDLDPSDREKAVEMVREQTRNLHDS